jgi:hypothetical protein
MVRREGVFDGEEVSSAHAGTTKTGTTDTCSIAGRTQPLTFDGAVSGRRKCKPASIVRRVAHVAVGHAALSNIQSSPSGNPREDTAKLGDIRQKNQTVEGKK